MNDLFFKNMNLSDEKVVGLLLAYRDKYDPYSYLGNTDIKMAVQGALPFQEEIIVTYTSLDTLIERCGFDEKQLKIIEMSGKGYTVQEIANETGLPASVIQGRFNTICKSVVKENLRQWRKATFVNVLGLKTKICSKCKEELPATHEFFNGSDWSKDGFLSICRKCKK